MVDSVKLVEKDSREFWEEKKKRDHKDWVLLFVFRENVCCVLENKEKAPYRNQIWSQRKKLQERIVKSLCLFSSL